MPPQRELCCERRGPDTRMRDAPTCSAHQTYTRIAQRAAVLMASAPAEAKTHGKEEQQGSDGPSFGATIDAEDVRTAGSGPEGSREEGG